MSQPSLAKVPRVVADRKAPVDLRVHRALRAYKVHRVFLARPEWQVRQGRKVHKAQQAYRASPDLRARSV